MAVEKQIESRIRHSGSLQRGGEHHEMVRSGAQENSERDSCFVRSIDKAVCQGSRQIGLPTSNPEIKQAVASNRVPSIYAAALPGSIGLENPSAGETGRRDITGERQNQI